MVPAALWEWDLRQYETLRKRSLIVEFVEKYNWQHPSFDGSSYAEFEHRMLLAIQWQHERVIPWVDNDGGCAQAVAPPRRLRRFGGVRGAAT